VVDDYLSEKEQWEWLKSQLLLNGPWIVAGIAAGALALMGWHWWQQRVDTRASAASAQTRRVAEAFERHDPARAQSILDGLAREQPQSPYLDQANLITARAFVETGDLDKAAARLRIVMDGTKDAALALVARERLARVEIAQNKPDEALATLNGADPGSFAARYHEVRAEAYAAKKDSVNALKEYRAAREADTDNTLDPQSLELKINDLVADEPPAAAAAAARTQ
jgi:predicted negative regulator of RcsB-dependent stress response